LAQANYNVQMIILFYRANSSIVRCHVWWPCAHPARFFLRSILLALSYSLEKFRQWIYHGRKIVYWDIAQR